MTRDPEALKKWYLQAMEKRIEELLSLRVPLEADSVDAFNAARKVGQALRGSGATFGFPNVTEVATLLETAPDEDVWRRVLGLVDELNALTAGEVQGELLGPIWLAWAAGLDASVVRGITDLGEAWRVVGRVSGVGSSALTSRVAAYLSLKVGDLASRTRAALRLVPEALSASRRIVPLREDPRTITVATSEPTSLATALELERLTGRRPVFEVASPSSIEALLGALYGVGDTATVTSPATPVASPGVLIADDESSARLLSRALLEKRGYYVVEAEDGLTALDLARGDERIGLVVADLNMPRMDGLELMWELRDAPELKHLPVIIVTGDVDEVLETQLLEEGANDYIRKPVDPRLFLARVEATLRRSGD